MKNNIIPLFPEKLYHIYNRGINGENLFIEERNYQYFLAKYCKFVLPVADLYTYCLLKNHFHLLVQIKPEVEIRKHFEKYKKYSEDITIDKLISKAFNSLFKSYAVTINNTYNRTGRLFEEPFLRVEVTDSAQITTLIRYIHLNPKKHGFTKDFESYSHSGYHELNGDGHTWLARNKVLNWFASKDEFSSLHLE